MPKKTDSINKQRAALNVSRLFSGLLSDDEARDVNGWAQDDKVYRQEFLANSHLLADVDALEGDAELLALVSEPTRKPRSRGVVKLSVAASLLLSVAMGVMLYLQGDTTSESVALRYVTRIGEVKTVNLTDGSAITLNTGTQIMVSMTENERRVLLERGEAYFDVARDESRPFSVDTGLRKITALGTEFSVHKRPEQLQVAVTEGMVCVHQQDEPVSAVAPLLGGVLSASSNTRDPGRFRIEAGWVAEVNIAERRIGGRMADNIASLSSWRNGILEFSRAPLYKVVQELNRYSGKKILVEDPAIIELKVSAVVHITRIDQMMRDLQSTMPIKVTNYFDRVVLTGSQ